MMWRPIATAAGLIVLTVLLWEFSSDAFEWLGLEVFDPLDRICLVFLVLTAAEFLFARHAQRQQQ